MTTLAQREANRLNAQRSTGPRTDSGKARSRGNALRHGLLAEKVMVIEDGSLEEFMELEQQLRDALDPADRLEEQLVCRVISLMWRLQRAAIIERGIIMLHRSAEGLPPAAQLAMALKRDAHTTDLLSRVGLYEQRLERSLYRTLRELERLQVRRQAVASPAPVLVEMLP